ncbi:MAG: hypothetical protein JXR45_05305 [Deltaproteobacteria bacterium]|nr:hypothetical protein [Deltaproteobacteria bacterium]
MSRIHAGFAGGIGLPKIPISHFRNPISFLAGGMVNVPVTSKIGFQVDGYALTTVSLGTVNKSDGKLSFNLVWGSANLAYQIRGYMGSHSAVLAGLGLYHLKQQFDNRKDTLDTLGLNIGLSQWMKMRKIGGFFEVRWHLLFKPSDSPQVLTLTYGLFL